MLKYMQMLNLGLLFKRFSEIIPPMAKYAPLTKQIKNSKADSFVLGGAYHPKKLQTLQALNFSTSAFPRLLKIERRKACSFVEIRKGANGIADVVTQMKKLVRNSTIFDSGLKDFIRDEILLSNGIDSHSQPKQILELVYNFVANRVKYISDVRGIESIQDARQTLSKRVGDCDDQAILTATILSILGFEPFFVLAKSYRLERTRKDEKYHEVKPSDFNHVYVMADTDYGIYFLDTTLENGVLGSQASSVFQRVAVRIWNDGENPYLEGIGSFFSNLGKGLLKAATPFVGLIPGVGPIASQALGAVNAAVSKSSMPFDFSKISTDTDTALNQLIDAVKNQGADYSNAVHQAEAVMNNFIGLNNNKKSTPAQKAANNAALSALTDKLNYLKTLKPENLAAIKAQETGVTLNADGTIPASGSTGGLNTTTLLIGAGVIGALFFILKK